MKTIIISLFFLSCQQPFGVVDRIEGDYMVIELSTGELITEELRDGISEGSVLNRDWTINEKKTALRRAENESLLNKLK